MSIDPIFWLLAAVGFLALEGMTFSMVSVWFAAGSAAALLCCLFTFAAAEGQTAQTVETLYVTAASMRSCCATAPLSMRISSIRR